MSQMVTRCPKCATAFRITSTQLELAKGAVRCGSCLHIFKAQDHLVSATPEPVNVEITKPADASTTIAESLTSSKTLSANSIKTTPSANQPATTVYLIDEDEDEELIISDDALISDDMDLTGSKLSSYEFDGYVDQNVPPKQTISLFEREIRYEPLKEDSEIEDESWAEKLLSEDEDAAPTPKKASPTIPSGESIQDEITQLFQQTQEQAAEIKPISYSAPLFSIIGEQGSEETELSPEFLKATQPPTSAKQESDVQLPTDFTEALQETPDEETSAQASKRVVKSGKGWGGDMSRAALLMNIIPAPVEFTGKRMRRWYQEKLWPSLAVIAAILLIIQVAYFKFDYFSRVEPYRTAYAFLCPKIGCRLPSLVDTTQIVATNLIVRNHPTIEHSLMVDAILINNAPYEQPYPDLLLAFSTIDDTPVASRRFTPKEYLGGEVAGKDHIPKNQPVHIKLELADPGSEAVNYHLSIP